MGDTVNNPRACAKRDGKAYDRLNPRTANAVIEERREQEKDMSERERERERKRDFVISSAGGRFISGR